MELNASSDDELLLRNNTTSLGASEDARLIFIVVGSEENGSVVFVGLVALLVTASLSHWAGVELAHDLDLSSVGGDDLDLLGLAIGSGDGLSFGVETVGGIDLDGIGVCSKLVESAAGWVVQGGLSRGDEGGNGVVNGIHCGAASH